jgi:DNA-binding transcriptional regulator LsrR (DeoR family)
MPRRAAPDLHLLTKVSTLYYVGQQTQQQIADRLRLSRPRISRLLTEAQERGIVQITISPPTGFHTELESRLESEFALEEALVVEVDGRESDDMLRRQIGAAGAAYLWRTLLPGDSIGLAWGTTLEAMAQAMPPRAMEDVTVVQTLGGIGPPDHAAYAAAIARRLATALGAALVLLPAPGIVASPGVRDALRADPHVQAALDRLDSLDTIYVGIGSLASNPLLTDGQTLPARALKELRREGAIGDIALRFFDEAGRFVRTSLDERILGITPDQLQRHARVVALAGGRTKADAMRAALRARVVNVLITDQGTARALLNGTKS